MIAALVVGGLAFTAPPASADTVPPVGLEETVTADVLPTAQIDGVVWTQAIAGNTVFVGGEFTTARPAGSAVGVNTVPRANLMAYDIRTGEMTPWNPGANAVVKSMRVSPDGSRLYVGGNFTQIGGATRYRIAAFSTSTGALLSWAPTSNAQVSAIDVFGDTVFMGGNFTSMAGGARPRLAAVSATTAALLPLTASLDGGYGVTDLVASPDGGKIVLTGSFTSANGSTNPGRGMVALDSTTGASVPWAINSLLRNAGTNAAMTSLTSSGDSIYGTGYSFSGATAEDGFEGTFRANWSDGSLVWLDDCHGDNYSVAVSQGVVYTASHDHYCGNIGAFPQTDPWGFHHSLAFSAEYRGNVLTKDVYGYKSYTGMPAATLLHWYPDWQVGTYTGKSQAVWDVVANDQYVVYGGEFLKVNNVAQQGLVRFAKKSTSPHKAGPQESGDNWAISAASLRANEVRLSWRANTDRDNEVLTYQVFRQDKGSTPIYTTTQASNFWTIPLMNAVDSTVIAGQTYNYRVRAIDPDGNQATGAWTSVTVASSAQAPEYNISVVDDGAVHYWPLGDSTPDSAVDWAGRDALTVRNATRGTTGPNLATATTATQFAGGSSSYASTSAIEVGIHSLTVEAWVKTSSTQGGKIVGFGNKATGNSGTYDRMLYIDGSGRISFGMYQGANRSLSSGTGFNNGQWHHVVGTVGVAGMTLYVDGARIATRADTTGGRTLNGYWRVGGDAISGWTNSPSSAYLNGQIADVAVYPTALTRTQVNDHWVASGRSNAIPPSPADAYGKAVYNLSPTLYWRLGESSGSAAADSGLDVQPGTYFGSTTKGASGALLGVADTAVSLAPTKNGSTWVQTGVTSDKSYANPTTFSVEAWFKTNTITGGKIVGFGSSRTGLSSSYDRHIYMSSDGTVNFGVSNGSRYIVSSGAGFNNNQWHHVVGQMSSSGMQLYIDGALVGSNVNAGATSYTGYWRVGGDAGWTGDTYWKGSVDDVAVYPAALSSADVLAHFQLGSLGFANEAPTATFTSVISDLAVAFDASGSTDVNNNIASYAWTFGDGGTATGVAPSHTYAAVGTYSVKLTVTDALGASSSMTQPVTVRGPNALPTASFAPVMTNLALAADASASTDSDGEILTYAWAYGDGSTGTGVTTAHTYASAGVYPVTLTVTDDRGGSVSTTQSVTATLAPNVLPTAAFTPTVNKRTVSVNGSASADADGTIASYAWNFGDGSTGTGATATRTYAAGGTYTVTLTVTDDRGGQATTTRSVVVQPNTAPTASFSTQAQGLVASMDGSASADADGAIASYTWTFGDGATGTGATTSHTYASAGAYVVTLTVTDSEGATSTSTKQVSVSVTNVIATDGFERNLGVGWGSSDVGGPWMLTGSASRFSTSGGAGNISLVTGQTFQALLPSVSSTSARVTAEFSVDKVADAQYIAVVGRQVGSSQYILRLRPESGGVLRLYVLRDGNPIGANVLTDVALVAGQKYTASFEVAGTSPTNLRAKVWKSSESEPAAWQITRTDTTAANQAPGSVGVFTWLPSSAGAFAPVVTSFHSIVVVDPSTNLPPANQAPVAAFVSTATGLSVSFDGTGSTDADGTIASYLWDFGDGSTATTATPQRTYAVAGSYTVTLTVADNAGAVHSASKAITVEAVNQAPLAAFTSSAANLVASFDASTSSDPDGTVASYAWSFGDGATGTGATASRTYAVAGTYNVTLTVTDNRGATNAVTKAVTVSAAPNVAPVAAFTSSTSGLAVTVDGATSSDPDGTIVSYAWGFGDGSTGSGATASRTYAAAGTYNVTLTVTDNRGGTNAITKSVTVTTPPVGNVLAKDTFARTTTAGAWGTADQGGAWTVTGTPARFSTVPGAGVISLNTSTAQQAMLNSVVGANTTISATFKVDKVANGQYIQVIGRQVGVDQYILRARIAGDGTVQLYVLRNGTPIGAAFTVPDVVIAPGVAYTMKFQAQGTGATSLSAKMWATAAAEPAAWQITRTDTNAALQAAGSVGVYGYVPTAAGAFPLALTFTDVTVTDPTIP